MWRVVFMNVTWIKYFVVVALLFLSLSVTANDDLMKAELVKHKGKVVYVDFWASWCGPCRKSFPWMNEIQKKYAQQGFTVVSVNLDSDKANALEFLEELPASFPVVYDPEGKIARQFKVKGMPSSYVFDRQGKLVLSHVGFFKDKIPQYTKEIEILLAK